MIFQALPTSSSLIDSFLISLDHSIHFPVYMSTVQSISSVSQVIYGSSVWLRSPSYRLKDCLKNSYLFTRKRSPQKVQLMLSKIHFSIQPFIICVFQLCYTALISSIIPVFSRQKNDSKTLISENSIICGCSLLSNKHCNTKLSFLLTNLQSLIRFCIFSLNKKPSKTSQQISSPFFMSSNYCISFSFLRAIYMLNSTLIGGTMLSVMQIIPHHDTVANVAYFNVCTSNKILTFSGIANHSPFGKVRVLLSSKTEFRFSTHSGSISPSKTIQWFHDSSPF